MKSRLTKLLTTLRAQSTPMKKKSSASMPQARFRTSDVKKGLATRKNRFQVARRVNGMRPRFPWEILMVVTGVRRGTIHGGAWGSVSLQAGWGRSAAAARSGVGTDELYGLGDR